MPNSQANLHSTTAYSSDHPTFGVSSTFGQHMQTSRLRVNLNGRLENGYEFFIKALRDVFYHCHLFSFKDMRSWHIRAPSVMGFLSLRKIRTVRAQIIII
jgi:hypothetical protein